MRRVIAVDGPAASGKGTIARAIARQLGLPHLDTGLLYRAVGIATLRAGGDPSDPATAAAHCGFDEALLADPALRTEEAGGAASLVSPHPAVRAALLDRQRAFAARPGGAVLDGRDIGTVIAPDADAKLFVTAAPEIRAARRHRELVGLGLPTSFAEVLEDIRARDTRDSSRSAAPLVQAPDAVLIDTSDMNVEQAIAAALAAIGVKRA
jgi:cytidylate kinase